MMQQPCKGRFPRKPVLDLLLFAGRFCERHAMAEIVQLHMPGKSRTWAGQEFTLPGCSCAAPQQESRIRSFDCSSCMSFKMKAYLFRSAGRTPVWALAESLLVYKEKFDFMKKLNVKSFLGVTSVSVTT